MNLPEIERQIVAARGNLGVIRVELEQAHKDHGYNSFQPLIKRAESITRKLEDLHFILEALK